MATKLFETPSGLGGSFTVSIVGELDANRVKVRVRYPTKDWDGYEFAARRRDLRSTGRFAEKRGPSLSEIRRPNLRRAA